MADRQGVKIVTIGGGSSYTPELMEGFIKRYDRLPVREIWLVDIEDGREKVETVGAMGAAHVGCLALRRQGTHLLRPPRGPAGRRLCDTQFRVGLLYARIKDERIPLSYGMLGQETNGAGGMFKAFRTIPVIGQIIADMRELCPDAWLINFTNPSGMVTEAAIKHFGWKKTIGLCNVPVGSMINEPKLIGYEENDPPPHVPLRGPQPLPLAPRVGRAGPRGHARHHRSSQRPATTACPPHRRGRAAA